MIRVNYPVGTLTHLRLRLELATRRTRRALEARRRALRAEAEARKCAREHQEMARERAACAEFTERYEDLVGLLCAAAHEGVTPEREEKYRARRAWFYANYPPVKPALAPHLTPDESDAAPALWGRRACDAFEALFFYPSLEGMLAADGGSLIGRLMRTQSALAAWKEATLRREPDAPA